MSTAEITAYLIGNQLAGEARTEMATTDYLAVTDRRALPEGAAEALRALGGHRFAYWLLRGCRASLGLPEEGW
jgi:hypothetical protein